MSYISGKDEVTRQANHEAVVVVVCAFPLLLLLLLLLLIIIIIIVIIIRLTYYNNIAINIHAPPQLYFISVNNGDSSNNPESCHFIKVTKGGSVGQT